MYIVRVEGVESREFVRLKDALKYGRRFRGGRRASWVDAHGFRPTKRAIQTGGAMYCEADSPVAIAAIDWVD